MTITQSSGSLLKGLGKDYMLSRPASYDISNKVPKNTDWVQASFLLPIKLDDTDAKNRRYTSASIKYTDASIGGNLCLNPPPQFTRFADVRDPGVRANSVKTRKGYTGGSMGMGRYYSEAIDDNNQIIHIRFGVPEYNSMWQFFTGFYDSGAALMARSGRASEGFINQWLRRAGTVLGALVMPLMIIPWALMMVGQMARYFLKWPASKFYYLKPAMPLYQAALANLVNQVAANMGVTLQHDKQTIDNIIGEEHQISVSEMRGFRDLLPDIIDEKGSINTYAIFNKAKRLQMRHEKLMEQKFQNGGGEDFFGIVRNVLNARSGIDQPMRAERPFMGVEVYLQSWLDSLTLSGVKDEKNPGSEKSLRINKNGIQVDQAGNQTDSGYSPQDIDDGLASFFLSEEADGGAWLSLRVDYTGTVSETFSNSFSENSMKQKINSMSSSARDMRINLADGNFDSSGITQFIMDGAKSIMTGVADFLQIGGLAAAAGNAFVDIPDYWENASASFSSTTYKISLPCPYNNPVYKMFYQMIPLCSILAGALPLATGKQSYTSPFMLEMYDRGRNIVRLGMIESITVTRGTGNTGFNNEGQALGLEVSFSIKNLSSIVAMPVAPGFSLFKGIFDSENAFTDYMLCLSGVKLKDIVNRWPMLQYQLAAKRSQFSQYTSAAYWGATLAQMPGVSLLGAIMKGTDKE